MNFGSKWRGWTRSRLSSGGASILVNISATREFDIWNVVRQGDPLSHSLYPNDGGLTYFYERRL